jgi:hypothetical protein
MPRTSKQPCLRSLLFSPSLKDRGFLQRIPQPGAHNSKYLITTTKASAVSDSTVSSITANAVMLRHRVCSCALLTQNIPMELTGHIVLAADCSRG